MDLLVAHATEMPPRFAELDLPDYIPPSVEEVVFTCLAKDPNDRYQSARDLAEAYETALAIDEMGLDTPVPAADDAGTAEQIPVLVADPRTISFQVEAWMPESIAVLKIRGFAQDSDGQIVESVPGLIRMQIEGADRARRPGRFSWFGSTRRADPLEMELHLHSISAQRGTRLLIQVVFRPRSIDQFTDPDWRERCNRTYVDLRGYLMGMGG